MTTVPKFFLYMVLSMEALSHTADAPGQDAPEKAARLKERDRYGEETAKLRGEGKLKEAIVPSVFRSARRDRSVRILDLTEPEVAAVIARTGGGRQDALAEARAHPSRVLANALVNACWRNGYVERVHAGRASAYPLLQRRIAPSQERVLMREVVDRFAQAMFAVWILIHESSRRSWEERVRPYHLVPARLVTPVGWSLREATRAVRLPGGEVPD